MANDPSVSVIIPVYNGERFLAEAVRSALAQTLLPAEIIVVDDGSTDPTPQIATDLAASSPVPIRYVHQANQGPAAARNQGLAIAKGEFIALLDADDLWSPDKLQQQVAYLQAHEEVDFVICHMELFLEPGTAGPRGRNRAYYDQQPPAMLPSALLVRKQAFDVVGGFDPTYFVGEDTDWFFRARHAGMVIGILPGVYLKRRFHQANLSRSPRASSQALLKAIRASVVRQRGGNG
jgi:glycosyltransferase involved in cell wall biosynthesis